MSSLDQRAAVVAKAKSREKLNQYTQGAKRTQVGSGWSDCSSFVRWCYLEVLGQDIGYNTVAQITNKKLTVVDSAGGKYPDEKKLLPGDLIYYKGSDVSRPFMVGHVEMYIGGGKTIGHGSGIGPTIKSLTSYSAGRFTSGKGYIRTLRIIPADEQAATQPPVVTPPAETPPTTETKDRILIMVAQVNIRSGPGTAFKTVKVAKQNEAYTPIDTTGWRAILLDGAVCWVSEKMSKDE